MKEVLIQELREFKSLIAELKRELRQLETNTVSRQAHRKAAESIANKWVEELRSPLEHKYKLDKKVIDTTSELTKQLHVLSRPNNLKSSYLKCLDSISRGFDDKFILPLQSFVEEIGAIPQLRSILEGLEDQDLTDYFADAIACAESGYYKASIVLGWCGAIDVMQKKVLGEGFLAFN